VAVSIGGGLAYVVGPMGAGKSLYGVRRIVQTLTTGGYAVTNIELLPGWADRVARHYGRTASVKQRRRIADKCRAHYVYEQSLSDAMRYRLPGKGEARGCFMWDEGHNDLNNRSWKQDGRAEILEWATQLRKLGFVGYLLSQHADNTDAALRRVANAVVRLQNQREHTRVLGVRITPIPLFLACWYPTHAPLTSKTEPFRVERYFLSWHKHLYDTFGLYHGLADPDDDANVIRLPAGGWQRPDPQGSELPPSQATGSLAA
jgi:hypothetical protein